MTSALLGIVSVIGLLILLRPRPAEAQTFGLTVSVMTIPFGDVGDPETVVDVNPNKPLYSDGEIVTLTALPPLDYGFWSWGGDIPALLGVEEYPYGENPIQIAMTGDIHAVAEFQALAMPQ